VPARPKDLPDFARPPVTEVVLGIQFSTLPKLHNYHMGLLWERVRDRYPNITEQGPIGPQFETFGGVATQEQQIRLEAILSPPMQRYWFEAPDASLMQIQQDRIIHNWRKRGDAEYPRYEPVRQQFVDDIEAFESFLRDYSLGEIRPNQAEISYINAVELADGAAAESALERVASIWRGPPESVGAFEGAIVQSRFVLKRDNDPFARMHVVMQPAVLSLTQAAVLRLDLTVRGKPADETIDSALTFLDDGRVAIVTSFAELTTPEMHEQWGRL
jgi:uncharacterized protein (TIGR04255 family)